MGERLSAMHGWGCFVGFGVVGSPTKEPWADQGHGRAPEISSRVPTRSLDRVELRKRGTLNAPDRDAVVAQLRVLMARLGRRRGVRHVALGASPVDGSWTWTDATGAADADAGPMGADIPWLIASVTKLYIAAVILRLHEQGRVDLHAPITTYLPEEFSERFMFTTASTARAS